MADDAPLPSTDSPERLFRDLRAAFRAWEERGAGGWSEERFRRLALRAFRLQYEHNLPYRRFCRLRDVDPGTLTRWREIPPVPTAGFRAVPLVVGGPEAAVLEFRTSGTTDRLDRRGSHFLRDPSLYRTSLESAFRVLVLRHRRPEGPEGPEDLAPDVLSLIPPFSEAPHSSLSWMVDALMERFGGERVVHAASADGVNWDAARESVQAAVARGRPLCVLTTTLAADEWMDRLSDAGASWRLPPGSLLVDTGGAKGRPGLDRAGVVGRVRERLGLPGEGIVNEFGMTELLSQRYTDPGLGGDTDWLVGPPWVKTRALDPETLDELPEGEEGVLCHFDLANAGSVCAVLTEDLGRVRDGRLQYRGRTAGSPPRGCSLATAELLEAQGEGAARRSGGSGGSGGAA